MTSWLWRWQAGVLLAMALFGALLAALSSKPLKAIYVPGRTSDGHYQIESDCNACHTSFAGVEQQACLSCHADELGEGIDAHRPEIFRDPRNAWMLTKIDAQRCVTCHGEHAPDVTHAMGVTVPADFCQTCHLDIAKERPSHAGFDPAGCATTACHRYHDNRALYEDFVAHHLDDPPTLSPAQVPLRNLPAFFAATRAKAPALAAGDEDGLHDTSAASAAAIREWATSSHARAGVNCRSCHAPARAAWSDRPGPESCKGCHALEVQGFLHGRHGMRLERGLTAMRPAIARLPMKDQARERELGCDSCHGAHLLDTRKAAADACVACHDDEHSRAYEGSKHAKLWRDELLGKAPAGAGVSCATCHLPRRSTNQAGHARVVVEHNQNDNLRPPEKLVRSVCLNCHGLGFSFDALSDRGLASKNFQTKPAPGGRTLELVRRRRGP